MVNLKAKPYNLDDQGVKWVKDTIANMTIEEKIGQLFLVRYEKEQTTNWTSYYPGGYLLFAKDFENHTKENIVSSNNGLLTTIAWNIDGKTEYALEGSVFVGGSAVQWLRDGMRLIEKSKDVEKSSREKGSNGVYVVPAFVGLGTPYWDNDARGSVFGLTRATTRENFINATVESIAYQSKDVMEVMKEDSSLEINTLSVDGGASSNNYLMKFQSDILNCKIIRPYCLETTALGAAYLAGLAVGFWENKEDLVRLHKVEQIFMPNMSEVERKQKYNGWKKAVQATMIFK